MLMFLKDFSEETLIMKQLLLTLTIIILFSSIAFSQTKNKGNYIEPKSEFFEKMKKDLDTFNKK